MFYRIEVEAITKTIKLGIYGIFNIYLIEQPIESKTILIMDSNLLKFDKM